METKNIKETALQLVSLGFIVAPSMPCGTTDRNDPNKPAKNPVGAWKDSTKPSYCICKTADDVERLWKKYPRANVGVFCGGESGIYCLDIDRKEKDGKLVDGFKVLRELGHDLEKTVPETIVSRTPSGGWHVYFKCSGSRKIWETQDFLEGLDIRGECTKGGLGGFAVEAPSSYQIPATKEIKHYEWIHSPSEYSIMECPDWLLDLADKATEREKRKDDKKVQNELPKQEKPAEGPLFDEDSPAFKAAVLALTRMHESIARSAKQTGHQPEDVLLLAVRLCRFNFGLNREASWKALNTKPSPEGKSWNERCKRADGETQWEWTREEFNHKFDDVESTPEKGMVRFLENTAPLRFGELEPHEGRFFGELIFSDQRRYRFSASADEEQEIFDSIRRGRAEAYEQWGRNHAQEQTPGNPKNNDLGNMTQLIVVLWLRSRGQFYKNEETKLLKDCLFFDKKVGRLLQLESDEFKSWVSNSAQFNRADKSFLRLFAFIQDVAMLTDYSTLSKPCAFVARRGDFVYISNGESKMAKCGDHKVELVRNGTDGVLFLCDQTLNEWRLLPEETPARDPFSSLMQFRDLSYDSWYGLYLVRFWYLNLFACQENHTPLLLTGERNSGKSHLARALGLMAGFPKREASIDPKKEEDFWVSINAPGLLLFDNIEEEVVAAKWFSSALEKVTTGGSKEVRQLFTQKQMAYESISHVIFSSKIPHYAANDGVAHRFVIVMLNANIKEFKDKVLKDEILARRDECMTWTARMIADVLATDAEGIPKNINERYPDFGEFAAKCGRVMGDFENSLKAIDCGEFEKSRIVLVRDEDASGIYQFLVDKQGVWSGYATDLARAIDPSLSEEAVANVARRLGKVIARLRKAFEVCFGSFSAKISAGRTKYEFNGLNELIRTEADYSQL